MISRFRALLMAVSFAVGALATAQTDPQTAVLPMTTKSARVHRILDRVWDLQANQYESGKAIVALRKTVKIDPDFAMGHEILAQVSLDPAEQLSEQQKAFATRSHASPGEQTLIEWLQNAADHKLIPAITNMNEVLRQYPHDKWVVFLANLWLMKQNQYERAAEVYEHSGGEDSPGLINDAAYTYAYLRQFDKSYALMDKYIAALPKEANPQDSYAELLRMAGHFDQAITHYRAALALNPKFYPSQFGIADTYSLMGDQVRARHEYQIAFRKFPLPELHRVQYQTRAATTYIAEGDFARADTAFQAIADYAHAKQMSEVEADTYRQMAIYQSNPKQGMLLLAKSEAAVHEGKNMSEAAIQRGIAQILRARVELELKMDDSQAANSALAQLAELSQKSDDSVIETTYNAAAGAGLFSEHKYKEAIPRLEEDIRNPLSLKLLVSAYQKTNDSSAARRTTETLANLNDPTLEQALVVPGFRKCVQDPSCNSTVKSVSLKP